MIEIELPNGHKATIKQNMVDLAIEAYNMGYKDGVEAYKAMMELEKEEKEEDAEDCISRQEALSHKHIVYDDDGIGYSVVRVDEIMALPSVTPQAEIEKEEKEEDILDKIKAEILDEAEYAYADFDEYKYDILHAETDELPDDDFRYGMERAVEIINKYKAESEE